MQAGDRVQDLVRGQQPHARHRSPDVDLVAQQLAGERSGSPLPEVAVAVEDDD